MHRSTLRHTLLVLVGPILGTSVVQAPAAGQDCEPDREVRFICGVPGPEDLLEIRGTPWVLASSRIADDAGYINVVHRIDHAVTTLFPDGTSGVDFDRETYPACPGPPEANFQPHGIALRYGDEGMHVLYVVGHGLREAVEIFALDASGRSGSTARSGASASPPSLTWIGCVVAPEDVSLNSVTALPDRALAATNFRVAGGEAWEWSPSAGWAKVPGTEMSGPNGIESSADGRWLFIGGWGGEELVRVSRGQRPVRRDAVGVGFHIDNVRWGPDGSILVAGQYGAPGASIGGCLDRGACTGVVSRAARLDPEELSVEPLVAYPSNPLFPFATVSIQVGEELWLGGIGGGTRIARFSAD